MALIGRGAIVDRAGRGPISCHARPFLLTDRPQQRLDILRGAGFAEQEPLSFGTAGALEVVALSLRLHTFRSRPHAQAARELHDSLDDGTGIVLG